MDVTPCLVPLLPDNANQQETEGKTFVVHVCTLRCNECVLI
jgi:hypothetical protein